uniref:Protocadherin 11 n=1 Tax=Eptatretus burgeri TaxID=7764 RepID=A0A8C4NCU6_EPTBU
MAITRAYYALILLMVQARVALAEEYSYRIPEELSAGKLIGNLASDLNLRGISPNLLFKIVSKYEGPPLVHVRNNTGELLTTQRRIDREQLCPESTDEGSGCYYEIQVVVLPNQFFRLIKVKILIEDINDHSPSFPSSVVNLSIPENMPVGSRFSLPAASDPDVGLNKIQHYGLSETGNAFTMEVIEGSDGEMSPQLLIRSNLDRERKDVYEMRLRAEDGGSPPRSSTALIRVLITDVNDNHPIFEQSQIEVKIPENTPLGTPVIQLHANDADMGANAEIVYTYSARVSPSARRLFQLDNRTGVIVVRGPLDREDVALYRLVILAIDKGPNPVPATATVTVSISDVNDNPPDITVHNIESAVNGVILLSEAAPPDTPIALIEVSDPDVKQNSKVTCHIEGNVPFQLKPAYQNHENQFLLETAGFLDYERQNEYHIKLMATDTGLPRFSSSATVTVRLRDENDNAPIFDKGIVEASIYENNAPGAEILTLSASDRDSGDNAQTVYFLGPKAPHIFRVNPRTGVLSATEPLDRETQSEYKFTVIARDGGDPTLESNTTIVIRTLDKNDNPPKFNNKKFDFFLSENLHRYGTVGVISVTDADEGKNALVTFSLVGNHDIFTINPVTGMIQSNITFDREQQASYTFEVQAVDAGEPPRTALAKVTIFIMDINDNAPTVLLPPSNASYRLVHPKVAPGTMVAEVLAKDGDTGINAELSYSIVGGNPFKLFTIDVHTGNITLQKQLSPEHQGIHRLVVRVNDAGFPESLYSIVLVNLFVNETIGNVSYVRDLIARSMKMPLNVDITGDGLAVSDINHYTIIIAMVAGAMVVVILVVIVVFFLRCRGSRAKNGVCRTKENENWLSPSQQDKKNKHRRKKKKRQQNQHGQVKTAPYSIVTIEESKADDPTYQTINETLEELEVDCRTIPRHNTFRPDGGTDSPDLAKHYRSTSPQAPVSPNGQTPPLSKNQNVVQELPAENTFVGIVGECNSKRSSTSSEHYSVSECSSQSGFRNTQHKAHSKQVLQIPLGVKSMPKLDHRRGLAVEPSHEETNRK